MDVSPVLSGVKSSRVSAGGSTFPMTSWLFDHLQEHTNRHLSNTRENTQLDIPLGTDSWPHSVLFLGASGH